MDRVCHACRRATLVAPEHASLARHAGHHDGCVLGRRASRRRAGQRARRPDLPPGQVSQELLDTGRRRQPVDVPAPADRAGRRARPGLAHRRRRRSCFDTDAGFGEALVARLNRFRIRVKADVEPCRGGCIAVRGVDGVDDVVGGGTATRPARTGPRRRTGTPVDELERARDRGRVAGDGRRDRARRDDPGRDRGRAGRPSTSRRAATPARSSSSGWTRGAPRRRAGCASSPWPRAPSRATRSSHDGAEVGVLTSVAGTRALGYVKRGVELGDAPGVIGAAARDRSRPEGGETSRPDAGSRGSGVEGPAQGDHVGAVADGASSGAWSITVASPSARRRRRRRRRAARPPAVSSSPRAPAARATVAASSGCGSRA